MIAFGLGKGGTDIHSGLESSEKEVESGPALALGSRFVHSPVWLSRKEKASLVSAELDFLESHSVVRLRPDGQ